MKKIRLYEFRLFTFCQAQAIALILKSYHQDWRLEIKDWGLGILKQL